MINSQTNKFIVKLSTISKNLNKIIWIWRPIHTHNHIIKYSKLTSHFSIALSGLNSSMVSPCSCTERRLSKVVLFNLPLRFPLVSFMAEKQVSFLTDVGGRLCSTSSTDSMLLTSWLVKLLWTSAILVFSKVDPNLWTQKKKRFITAQWQ